MSFKKPRKAWPSKPKLLFATYAPKKKDPLKEFIGKTVMIDSKPVVIKSIVGSMIKPAFYEINGEHWIGMLRFHAYMNGDKTIPEQEFLDFEAIEFEVVNENKSILEVPNVKKQ